MAKSTKPTASQSAGYKNPPKHTQWKKGQSGNPAGKPKKSDSIKAKLNLLAGKEIVVIENGTQVLMTQDEAMLVAVFMKAMKGDMTAVKFVTENLSSDEVQVAHAPPLKITPDDINVLKHRADWIGFLEQAAAELAAESENTNQTEENQDDDDDAF